MDLVFFIVLIGLGTLVGVMLYLYRAKLFGEAEAIETEAETDVVDSFESYFNKTKLTVESEVGTVANTLTSEVKTVANTVANTVSNL